jgi:hypothetical protein
MQPPPAATAANGARLPAGVPVLRVLLNLFVDDILSNYAHNECTMQRLAQSSHSHRLIFLKNIQ